MKIGRIEALRSITALLLIFFLLAAAISGLMYGTSCALTFGSFTLISPLELLLLILGAKNVLVGWLAPGLMVIFIIMLFGRFFCGWICPVGILLEYSHFFTETRKTKTATGLHGNRERYVILLAVLAASLLFSFAAPYLFSPPGAVYRTTIYFVLHGVIGADLMVLSFFFVLDLFAIHRGRTWCNTLCPLGTTISSLSIINFIKPRVDAKACINYNSNCLNCETVCPMRIPVTRADKRAMMQCHKCLKCWANCPVKAIKIEVF